MVVVPGGPASKEYKGDTIEKCDTITAIDPDGKSGLIKVPSSSFLPCPFSCSYAPFSHLFHKNRCYNFCYCIRIPYSSKVHTNNVIELLRGKDVIGSPLTVEVVKHSTLQKASFCLKRADYR